MSLGRGKKPEHWEGIHAVSERACKLGTASAGGQVRAWVGGDEGQLHQLLYNGGDSNSQDQSSGQLCVYGHGPYTGISWLLLPATPL